MHTHRSKNQYEAAVKSGIESQLARFSAAMTETFSSVQKVLALNTVTASAVVQETLVATNTLLSARDPREILLLATRFEPKLLLYGWQLADILLGVRPQITRQFQAESNAIAQRHRAAAGVPVFAGKGLSMLKSVRTNSASAGNGAEKSE